MDVNTAKGALARYFDLAHDAVLWKLDGLSEHELRRPLTPTGTSMLGIVKHLGSVEFGYFGDVFGRPHDEPEPPNADDGFADMYARADESVDDVLAFFGRARAHANATIEALDLDAEGHVPWWGDANPITLQRIMVHMTTEIWRHLGQLDVLREMIDGAVGHRQGVTNMPGVDEFDWPGYVAMLQSIADEAASS